VSGATIAEAWDQALLLFRSPEDLYRHDSERGVAFEITGLTVVVESAKDLTPPARYRFSGLIAEYTDRLFGADRHQSMLYQRMRNWPTADGKAIDQLVRVQEILAASPDTRTAAFTLWRPEDDLQSSYSVSPVSGCFRIISGCLQLHLVARSVDFWVGAIPELIAYGKLSNDLAATLRVNPGPIVYHVWSAHIYEDDCLAHVVALAAAPQSRGQP
jgi:thymidylate synthase